MMDPAEIKHRLEESETELARAQKQRALLEDVVNGDKPRAEWDLQIAEIEGHLTRFRALENILTGGHVSPRKDNIS
jgi:hypothetical protein